MSRILAPAALLLAVAAAQEPPPGLADLHLLRGGRARQFSSADPDGGNEDHGRYLETRPDGTVVLARVAGPGRVVRIWSANPQGRIEIAVDGEVAVAVPFARLFDQSLPPFVAPLSCFAGGGAACHVPIPFRHGLEIRVAPERPGERLDFYWQVGVEELGPEAVPAGFALPPPAGVAEEAALLARPPAPAARTWEVLGLGPRRVGEEPLAAAAGGAGLVRQIRFTVSMGDGATWRPTPAALETLVLRIWWDGRAEPSVAAPLGAFLGCAFGAPPPATAAFRLEGEELVCDWPMPFGRGFRLELAGWEGCLPVKAAGRILVERGREPGAGRFHARWRRERAVAGRPVRVLEAAGRGHFVGLFAAMQGPAGDLSFLEGDERIAVDGEVRFLGTGTEDYFGGAWYFASGPFSCPFHGLSVKTASRIAACRLHIPDPVPFRESFVFDLEHGGGNDRPGAIYQLTSFWYGEGAGPAGSELLPPLARLFPPEPGAAPVEAEEAWAEAGRPAPLRWGGPRAGAASAGAWVELGPGGGPGRFLLGYLPPGKYLLDLVADGGGWRLAGPGLAAALPPAGPGFAPVRAGLLAVPGEPGGEAAPAEVLLAPEAGAGALLVDAFLVRPYLPAIRAWSVVGPFPSPGRTGFDLVFPPERDGYTSNREIEGIAGEGPRRWRAVDLSDSATGYLDLNRFFSPRELVVAYATCFVTSPEDQEGELVLGSDDGVKAWWNGELKLSRLLIRGAGRDDERIRVRIAKGANTLLMKVENNLGGWGLYGRIEGARGLSFSAEPAGSGQGGD